MEPTKATREQLKRHNRQLVLRAIYNELADNRAALAVETGLTKPTVSDIVEEFIEGGFVEEGGFGYSRTSGGKPPRLLRFLPMARQVIGISITTESIVGVLANLTNDFIIHHEVPITPHTNILHALQASCNALLIQADAPIVGMCVGLSGIIDTGAGVVIDSPALGLQNFNLVAYLKKYYPCPIMIANNTELATRAQVLYKSKDDTRRLVTLFINNSVEVGFAFGKDAYHHASDISRLPFIMRHQSTFEMLRWQNVYTLIQAIKVDYPDSYLHRASDTYLDLRWALSMDDAGAQQVLSQLITPLSQLYAWIISLMRPNEIVLSGAINSLGSYLSTPLEASLQKNFPPYILENLTLSYTESVYLILRGSIAEILHRELGIL